MPGPVPWHRFLSPLLLVALASACSNSAASESADATSDTEGGTDAEAPALVGDPQLVLHPNQPMVVDVIVTLDRPAELELVHDQDPGVRVASLSVEDEGRRHHLRLRGLAPASAHSMTLARVDPSSGASESSALAFLTNAALPGFRPSWEIEVADPDAVDPAYRYFDYAYTALWDPTGIFVIDAEGRTRWYYADTPFYTFFGALTVWAGIELRDDGTLLAVRDGEVTILDELGEIRRRYSASEHGLTLFHHDAVGLASGNILTLGNDFREIDLLDHGPTLVAADYLVEFNPAGEIVWTWSAFDHLDPQRVRVEPGPDVVYINSNTGELAYDWTHGNGMVDMPEDGLLLLSMRHQDWIVAIDHDTGEIVWRLGDEGDFELLDGTWFYHQHSPQWQPDGTLLLYDNGIGNPNLPVTEIESRAVRYALDFDAMTATQVWDDRHEPRLCPGGGDADRTPAGNLLVLDTSVELVAHVAGNYSRLRELANDDPQAVWSLTTPTGSLVYRATASTRLPGEPLEP
jgi:outer membrane protein assembly factor BamB